MLKTYTKAFTKLEALKNRFIRDESGASLVEYSVLVGIITVGAIAMVQAVGGYVTTQWTALATALGVGPAA